MVREVGMVEGVGMKGRVGKRTGLGMEGTGGWEKRERIERGVWKRNG